MPKTVFNEYTYPEEDQDPYFTSIVNFYNQQDLCSFNNKVKSHMILAGGGTVVFDSGTGLLTWTDDFVCKNLVSGYLTKYRYGPDGISRAAVILDGQILYGIFSSIMSRNEERNLAVADKIDKGDNYIVLAFRYGGKIYFSNGTIL